MAALRDVLWISVAIAALLAIVGFSYRQTVRAYSSSGGAYIVAKENLGTLPSLVAAAALLTDYVLTVAVSICGRDSRDHLGGARTALGDGAARGRVHRAADDCEPARRQGGRAALRDPDVRVHCRRLRHDRDRSRALRDGDLPAGDGAAPARHRDGHRDDLRPAEGLRVRVERPDGRRGDRERRHAFRRPQSQNAARTLLILIGIAISLFLGVSYLAVQMHARPSATVSVLSQIGRASFPGGSGGAFVYYLLQGFTFAILLFAANTSFQGFPRLAALLARDRFFPRQFVNLGDRLVYSNGIVAVAGLAIALIVAFRGNVISLLHLYVVGVFTAFTLSQLGMVRYWLRRKERRSAFVNGLGGVTTGLVTLIVVETKFTEGAWAVIVAIPLFVLAFYGIRRHYRKVARRLRAGTAAVAAAPPATNTVVLQVEELNDATRQAIWYVRRIAGDGFRAVRVPDEKRLDPRGGWWDFGGRGVPLETLAAPEGRVDGYLEYVWALPRGESNFVTVVIPEQFERRSLLRAAVERRSAFLLKLRLLKETGIAITDVPFVRGEAQAEPERLVCRVLVSGAHAASLRAVQYARTLGIEDTRAVFFAFDADDAARMRHDWQDGALEVIEAPYRDLGDPLLRYLRELTAEPGTVVSVVMPELVVGGWRRLLHNQRALYVKRQLLFEPRVILSSVPYQLR